MTNKDKMVRLVIVKIEAGVVEADVDAAKTVVVVECIIRRIWHRGRWDTE